MRRKAGNAADLRDISTWRRAAGAAAVGLAMLLGAYGVAWLGVTRPLPPRERLERIDGIVEKMEIRESENCCYLVLRIDTGSERIKVESWLLQREIASLKPLPPGAPVTVLAELEAQRYLIWELRSAGRVLIPYEAMYAARQRQLRVLPWVGYLIAALCLPLAGILVAWPWVELSRLVRSIRFPGRSGRWD